MLILSNGITLLSFSTFNHEPYLPVFWSRRIYCNLYNGLILYVGITYCCFQHPIANLVLYLKKTRFIFIQSFTIFSVTFTKHFYFLESNVGVTCTLDVLILSNGITPILSCVFDTLHYDKGIDNVIYDSFSMINKACLVYLTYSIMIKEPIILSMFCGF